MPSSHDKITLQPNSQYLERKDPITRILFKHGDSVIICSKNSEAVLVSSLTASENRCPFCGELLVKGPLPYTVPLSVSEQKGGTKKNPAPPIKYDEPRRQNRGPLLGIGIAGIFTLFLLCAVGTLVLLALNNGSAPTNPNPAPASYTTQKPSPTSVPIQVSFPTQEPTSVPNTPVKLSSSPQQPTSFAKISCADKIYFVNLRRTPGYSGKDNKTDSLYEVPCGETVELLGPTKNVDGLTWWNVSWDRYTGWVADHTASGKTILIFNP